MPQVQTDENLNFGNSDVHVPGAYLEEDTSDLLPTGAVAIESATQHQRTRRLPARFRDTLPKPPTPVSIPQPRLPTVYLMVTNPLKTAVNIFGLFQQYLFHPSHDPNTFVDPGDLSNLTSSTLPPPPPRSKERDDEPPWPFSSMLVWRLMRWINTGSNAKSEGEVNRLVDDVLNAPDFSTEDLRNFRTNSKNNRLDAANNARLFEDGFQVTSITIEVLTGEPSNPQEPRTYAIPGLRY